jgi:hypothetical protein
MEGLDDTVLTSEWTAIAYAWLRNEPFKAASRGGKASTVHGWQRIEIQVRPWQRPQTKHDRWRGN